jgi:hypothetical protein
MSNENKKWAYRGLTILFLFVAAFFFINWIRGNPNAITSVLFNLVIAAICFYLSIRSNPIEPGK